MKYCLMLAVWMAGILPGWAEEAPFRVAVVPTMQRGEEAWIWAGPKAERAFYVVLTNVSATPQRAFETWNSWGYGAVSFVMTLADGTEAKIMVGPKGFTRNYPATFTIPPQGHMVIPVVLNPKDWEGIPNPKGGPAKVRLRAIYEAPESKQAKENGVWTGRVESAEIAVEVQR